MKRLVVSLLAAWVSQAAAESCLTAQDFKSVSATQFSLPDGSSVSRLELTGTLLYRELLAAEEFYWLGFELYQPSVRVDAESGSSPAYSVPFAAKIKRSTGRVSTWHYNADLKPEDREKLNGIYETLHLNPAPAGANPASYTVNEADTLGQYEARYLRLPDGTRTRSRQQYTRLRPSGGSAFNLSEAIVHSDEFTFRSDNCWHTKVTGRSDIELSGGNDLNIRVRQRLNVERLSTVIPADARLPKLPMNPLDWPQIPLAEIYPPEPRNPLASVDDFLQRLATLDGASRQALKDFLYDNDIYLSAIGDQIRGDALSDDFEKRLLLMIGKADTPNAHALLADLAVDTALDDNARFRSLMALRYSENPIAESDLEMLFGYAENADLSGDDAEIANSAMMVLGIISRTQADCDFGQALSDRLMAQLYATTSDDRAAALLTAVGNSGDLDHVEGVGDYLDRDDPKLRARAADALGNLPSAESQEMLRKHLDAESNDRVKVNTLKALGKQELESQAVNTVFNYADRGQDDNIRRAAIETLANQAEANPDLKPRLKQLMKGERDRRNLQTLMKAIY
ncbi:MAG: HEAT repeat domain-containing protein [Pseudomonadota bacterium]